MESQTNTHLYTNLHIYENAHSCVEKLDTQFTHYILQCIHTKTFHT